MDKWLNRKFVFQAIGLFLISLGLGYFFLFEPNADFSSLIEAEVNAKENTNTVATAKGEPGATVPAKVESVDVLVDGLRSRLDANPEDLKGWVLLAKSYHYLQRWDDASFAYNKAKALGYEGQPFGLQVDSKPVPTHQLKPFDPSSPPSRLARQIIETTAQTSANDTSIKNRTESSKASVRVKVGLNNNVLNTVKSDTAVYVFVLAAELIPGSASKIPLKAPLAVTKKSISDFPLEIVMDDSMAMIPGNNISSVENIIVGARVSLTGNPIRQVGDFETLSGPFSWADKKEIELTVTDKIEDKG